MGERTPFFLPESQLLVSGASPSFSDSISQLVLTALPEGTGT